MDSLKEIKGKLNKSGEIEMTKADYAKVHKDFKTKLSGEFFAMQIDPKTGGSALFPVKFIKESTPNFQFAVAVARDDASDAIQTLKRANIEPNTIFSEGPLTLLAFNVSENSTSEKRFEIEDITKVLDLEGVAHTVMDGKSFKAQPVSLDLDSKNDDSRVEK